MFNIALYIPKYVRLLHASQENLELPFSQTQFGVVLMVDVVGFSTLTTLATEKGDSGAEAIALEIGAYMGECIRIIEFYGGDVVKFLGDAVLVSFQPNIADSQLPNDSAGDFEESAKDAYLQQKSILVRRAVECGLQLLARLSHYRVYLTAEERTKHRTPSGEIERQQNRSQKGQRFFLFDSGQSSSSNEDQHGSFSTTLPSNEPSDSEYTDENDVSFDIWKCLPFTRHASKKKVHNRRASISSVSCGSNKNDIILELHIAVSSGDITNIIIGETKPGHCVRNFEHPSHTSTHEVSSKRSSTINADHTEKSYGDIPEYTGRLEYAICGPAVEYLDEALSTAKGGEMSITADVYDLVKSQALDLTFEKRKQFYIVKSNDPNDSRKGNGQLRQHGRKPSNSASSPGSIATISGLWKQPSALHLAPPSLTIENVSFLGLSDDVNPNYFKYVNRSALVRLRGTDGNFPAQFRDVTIMFVSLGKLNVATSDGLQVAQKAAVVAMQLLVKYEGTLQQFAVDDKGATLLAVFGLPPLSHEREAVFAAKAAIELRDAYCQLQLPDFAIALSTGIIFNAVLPQGNPYRRDPSISGDTIVLAVRMLKFPFSKKNVICDAATKQQIGGLCEFQDMGENFVKGKVKPVQMYSIQKFGSSGRAKRISQQNFEWEADFIGYKSEMKRAIRLIDDWIEAQNHHLLVISGSSGVGKSFFCHALNKRITSQGFLTCMSNATEVEKSSKYYLVKNLLLSLFDIIDSDRIPYNSNRRVSVLNTSSGSYLYNIEQTAGGRASPASSVSATSISNHERFRRMASFSSAVHSFYAETHRSDAINDSIELITRCLQKCGEDEQLLPLFKAAFSALADVEENKYTVRVDGRARDILLTGVFTRMVRYVSDYVGLVFFCDDVQWADPASIRVMQSIHEHCRSVMLIMATRPIRDYNATFIRDFYSSGSVDEIPLNGLGADEIGEIILQRFHSGVNSVSPEIVRVIQQRTGGNPLYVKNVSIVLKDFNHVTVVDGELVPSSNRFDLEDLLDTFDHKRIIKMQYDRLDHNFQEFLTVASCLDQYFTLYEVEAAISPNNTIFQNSSIEKIRETICKYDTYQFLQCIDNGTGPDSSVVLYSFSHITIPQSIYDMFSYERRMSLHYDLAVYYKSQLAHEDVPELLGKVTRHYLRTDSLEDKLYFLNRLADLNIKSYLLPEATNNMQQIVKILDENENRAIRFGRLQRSDVYLRLGMCYTMRTKLNEGEHYLYKALEALGQPWPRSDLEFMYKFWTNRLTQHQHRRWGPLRKIAASGRKRAICERIVRIMVQLSNIYFFTGKGEYFVYTCLIGLNACEQLGDKGPRYTLFLARNSLLCWLNDQKEHSIFYISKALRHMDQNNDAGTLTICAFLRFAAGKFNDARDHLYRSIQAVKTLGVITDCQAFYRSVGLVITMRIFEGTLDNSPEDLSLLKQMADTAHSNGDFEAEIWLGVYKIGNALVMDRLRDCEPFVALLETHLKEAADYNRIAIFGTLLCYYARVPNYENARRHLRNLVHILPALTVTPNIFPIFGLIFATMGLYRLIEDEQVDLISADDAKNYDKFNLGVARINHAFQQVKFWEFTQPCLYLARALPYISTGRTVEGYLVLRHGIMEMHFIQEIRFLKAYYWANLGKYAFTPCDRKDWTARAQADLDALGIPSHVYCNPNPSSFYSQGKPADLRDDG